MVTSLHLYIIAVPISIICLFVKDKFGKIVFTRNFFIF